MHSLQKIMQEPSITFLFLAYGGVSIQTLAVAVK
jgi:hypothetical protein